MIISAICRYIFKFIILFIAGETLSTVLAFLRERLTASHDALIRDYENYAACVEMLETGYFRKRTSQFLSPIAPNSRSIESSLWNGRDTDRDVLSAAAADAFDRHGDASGMNGLKQQLTKLYPEDFLKTSLRRK